MDNRTYIVRWDGDPGEYNEACGFLDNLGLEHDLLVNDGTLIGRKYTFPNEEIFVEYVLIYG